jgi:hypothetical protein
LKGHQPKGSLKGHQHLGLIEAFSRRRVGINHCVPLPGIIPQRRTSFLLPTGIFFFENSKVGEFFENFRSINQSINKKFAKNDIFSKLLHSSDPNQDDEMTEE